MKPNVSATGLVLLLATLVAPSALAAPSANAGGGSDAELGAGLWMVDGEGDEPWLAPQVSTEVHLHVDGIVAHARVEQLFDNPSEEAVEAVYVFPVADGAAVDGLSLQVGVRALSAELRENAGAASAFESAADGGRVAALVTRERRDMLATRVANIPPGATVTVTIRYRQLVGAAHGVLRLDVPTTFIPRPGFGGAEGSEGTRAAGARERVATRLEPPVALDGSGPLFDAWVELDGDVQPGSVQSSSHAIDVAPRAGGLAIRLSEGPVLADRDFVLRWSPRSGDAAFAPISEEVGGSRYVLAALPIPLETRAHLDSAPGAGASVGTPHPPRDITFVVDTSRSMAGASLAQAAAALSAALARLTPTDHFNVIEAASPPRLLFEGSRPASALAIAQALERAGALRAAGDTALAPALELALAGAPRPERSERIVLISDGDIPDERQLIRQVERGLGPRRLFTLGVGPAPGRLALRGTARAGRGTFTSIGDLGEVPARVAELDAELGAPTVEGLAVSGAGADARLQPELHAGEPLLVLARLAPGAGGVTLTGRSAGEPWQRQIGLGSAARNTRLDRLWAWRELELLEATAPGVRGDAARRLALARQRGLASALTSFVAVDSERSVEQRAPRSAVPLALPAGSEMFGELPQFPPPGPTCSRDPRGPRGSAAPRPAPQRPVAARAHVQCGLSG